VKERYRLSVASSITGLLASTFSAATCGTPEANRAEVGRSLAAPHEGDIVRYLPNSDGCYVCGRANPAGLAVRFRVEGDEVVTEFTADATRCGYNGVVHGGVLSALLDEAMGWTPTLVVRRLCVGAELQIRFVKPVPVGRRIFVRARLTGGRGRLWQASGEIRGEDGAVLVRGSGRFVPMSVDDSLAVLPYLLFDEDTIPASELLEGADGYHAPNRPQPTPTQVPLIHGNAIDAKHI
jgi:uncharacterized protein (TIGR00369 family)